MGCNITYYPLAASKDDLDSHLASHGFVRRVDAAPGRDGAASYRWQTEGVEATLYPLEPRDAAADRASSSQARIALQVGLGPVQCAAAAECQHRVIQDGLRKFGGRFHNDWYDRNGIPHPALVSVLPR